MKLLFTTALVVVLAQAHAGSLSLNAQFASFKHSHGKQYTDAFEEVKRNFLLTQIFSRLSGFNIFDGLLLTY